METEVASTVQGHKTTDGREVQDEVIVQRNKMRESQRQRWRESTPTKQQLKEWGFFFSGVFVLGDATSCGQCGPPVPPSRLCIPLVGADGGKGVYEKFPVLSQTWHHGTAPHTPVARIRSVHIPSHKGGWEAQFFSKKWHAQPRLHSYGEWRWMDWGGQIPQWESWQSRHPHQSPGSKTSLSKLVYPIIQWRGKG